jgi:hypothetical protein
MAGRALTRRAAPTPLALLLVLAPLALAACTGDDDRQRGHTLVEKVRSAHGSDRLDRAVVSFDFRGDRYTALRDGGRFTYRRIYTDTTGALVVDELGNEGPRRQRGGVEVTMTGRQVAALETQVNSVIYFALLPYNLADDAVEPRWRGESSVRGEQYDLLEVTFRPAGGGRDWEDTFVYWVHRQRGTMDYLAYDFHTGDGGTRFREAFDPREITGVRFQDYRNYSADHLDSELDLSEYAGLFEEGRLELISEVILENVRVMLPEGAADGLEIWE